MTSFNMEETLSTIFAMRHQEETGYKCSDYLYQSQPNSSSSSTANGPLSVDVDCRTKMAAWCYQVVDFCKFNRETVEIAMSYLDRYMQTTAGAAARTDRRLFQLASMTALYTAVKIHEPEAMDPKLVSNLSRGTYSVAQVEAMEASLLTALQWRMNPPTALAFVRAYLDVLPADLLLQLDETARQTVYDLAKYQTELAVNEYNFVTVPSSVTAFCSLMNALESLNGLNDKVLGYCAMTLAQAAGINVTDTHVLTVQNWLYQAIVQQQQPSSMEGITTTTSSSSSSHAKHSSTSSTSFRQSNTASPVAVANKKFDSFETTTSSPRSISAAGM